MFKVKKFHIDTNHDFVVMLLEEDASFLGLQSGDRIKVMPTECNVSKKKCEIICDLHIVGDKIHLNSKKGISLKRGEIGLLENVFAKLNLRANQKISIAPAKKPTSLDYVRLKFEGKKKLSESNFLEIIRDITVNRYSDVETTFFVLACSAHPLDDDEVIGLTKAMVSVGKVLSFNTKNNIIVDKHCIGGIPGNRTTMLVVPIVAAAGLLIPKTSSRSITSPSGTADTMEVLANVNLEIKDLTNVVENVGGCIVWGGALDLSPADDIIINVEHPLAIDSEGQMIASILSKKKSAGSSHVLIDIPIGKTAKIVDKKDGLRLKKRFEKVGKAIGLNVKVILTDGSQPVGRGIGPLLEAEDVLKVLNNDSNQPLRLRAKAIRMAGEILEMGGKAKVGGGEKLAREILDFGLAKKKFDDIIDSQGRKKVISHGKYCYDIISKFSGKVVSIDNKEVSKIAFMLGAPVDKAAGLYLCKRVGDSILEGECLYKIYSNSELKLKYVQTYLIDNGPYEVE